jgi:hypothetical protein
MGFLSKIFGGGESAPPVVQEVPEPVEEELQTSPIDPAEEEKRLMASKSRKELLARRGRSALVTSRERTGTLRSGVSVASSEGGGV